VDSGRFTDHGCRAGIYWAGICRTVVMASIALVLCSMVALATEPCWPPWDYSVPATGSAVHAGAPSVRGTASVAAVAAIRFYQVVLSKRYNAAFNPGGCSFRPSCSEYGLLAFKRYGAPRAFLMTEDRLMRCHPWAYLDGYELDETERRTHFKDSPCWLGRTNRREVDAR
jgi:uncharacterized protein